MNLVFKPYPICVSSLYTGEDPEVIISNAIREGKEIEIYAKLNGTRKVDTSIQFDKTKLGLNIPVEGFQYAEEATTSMLNYESSNHHYFKKLKSQGIEEYKTYLKAALAEVEKKWAVKIQQESITVYCQAF